MSKTYKVVKEFSFPTSQGFTGSAGKQSVSAYAVGGKVATPCACGGYTMRSKGGKSKK